MAESKRENYAYMDVLRCGGIYLVMIGHCISGTLAEPGLVGTAVWWICDILNSAVRTGLAMFFVLSGALLLPDERTLDVIPFYRRRLKKLLVPFLCWDLVYFLEGALLQGQGLRPGVFFTELLTLRGSKYHLWFVYKLVSIYLLLPFLKRVLDRCGRREQGILLFVILLPSSILPLINLLPFVSVDLFSAPVDGRVGFFLLGYLLARSDPAPRTRRWIYAGGAAALVLNVLGNYWLSSTERVNLWFNDGCALTHYIACAAAFLLARNLFSGEGGRLRRGIAALAGRLSGLTYGMYLCHVLFLDLAIRLAEGSAWGTARRLLFYFLFTALCATAAAWLLSRERHLRRLLVTG